MRKNAALKPGRDANGLRSRPVHRRLPHDADARSRPGRARAGAHQSRDSCWPSPTSSSNIAATTQPRGLKVLYEDPKLGFQVLAHINDKARVSPPHDHGASWAIYGQATKYTDMIEWEREDNGADPEARQAQAGEEIPADARQGRHLSGRHHPLDRLSRTMRASSASPAPISTRSRASRSI